MGCASSTPLVATAGSEMLKTASHVANDTAKSAEDAVQDVTHSLGKSLETAKESVGTAVHDMTNELGNAIKEKTDMLDDAKNNLMEKLHLGGAHEEEIKADKLNPTEAEIKHETDAKDEHEVKEDDIPTRVPTPTTEHDADSLKTSTPKPEIEQALANQTEDGPPTPKPNIAELERLTLIEVVDKTTAAALAKNAEALKEKSAVKAVVKSATAGEDKSTGDGDKSEPPPPPPPPSEAPVEKASPTEERRPSTTEWEKYADMLSQNLKFTGNDPFNRLGGKLKNQFPGRDITTTIQLPNNPIAIHRLRDPSDSGMSDSSSIRSGQQLPHTLNAANAKKFQREFASLIGCEPSPLHRVSSSKSIGLANKFGTVSTPNRSRSPAKLSADAYAAFASNHNNIQRSITSPNISRQSTKNSLYSKTSPNLSRSSTKNSLYGSTNNLQQNRQVLPTLSLNVGHKYCKSPTLGYSDDFLSVQRMNLMGAPRSPGRVMNTSSFLSSPRTSPFCVRKHYSDYLDPDHRPAFVADLSSMTTSKTLISPSPYKIRERCAVCYNKYVIK